MGSLCYKRSAMSTQYINLFISKDQEKASYDPLKPFYFLNIPSETHWLYLTGIYIGIRMKQAAEGTFCPSERPSICIMYLYMQGKWLLGIIYPDSSLLWVIIPEGIYECIHLYYTLMNDAFSFFSGCSVCKQLLKPQIVSSQRSISRNKQVWEEGWRWKC